MTGLSCSVVRYQSVCCLVGADQWTKAGAPNPHHQMPGMRHAAGGWR